MSYTSAILLCRFDNVNIISFCPFARFVGKADVSQRETGKLRA